MPNPHLDDDGIPSKFSPNNEYMENLREIDDLTLQLKAKIIKVGGDTRDLRD